MPDPLYTIGHSNHAIEHFVGLLQQHAITAVCDVRSRPYSRYSPQFDREALKLSLNNVGIRYVFLGKELGARSDDSSCYLYGQIQFDRLAETTLFQHGLRRVQDGMVHYSIALMCAEKEPLECHRTVLVARHLADLGIDILHILADGQIETHTDALIRLARLLHLREGEHHLFRTPADLFADAYALQGRRIGYETNSLRTAGDEE